MQQAKLSLVPILLLSRLRQLTFCTHGNRSRSSSDAVRERFKDGKLTSTCLCTAWGAGKGVLYLPFLPSFVLG